MKRKLLDKIEREIRDSISARKAYEHIIALTNFGNRFEGTPGDLKVAKYVEKLFRELGLEVEKTRIVVPSFEEKEISLKTIGSSERSFTAVSPYFSPSTPSEGITAEAVFVGDGEETNYNKVDVKGKIAVIRARAEGPPKFWMGQYVPRAAVKGAVGVILIHNMPWAYRASMETGLHNISKRFHKRTLPTLCISSIDGQDLLYLMGKGNFRLSMTVRTAVENKESYIVSGIHKGSKLPKERVAVIAHRDNGIAPGANDNGSGTSTMLEIARALSKRTPKRTLEFISSTAEEGVTIGAWKYVDAHREQMSNFKAVFNIDMIAVGGRLNLIEKGVWPDLPNVEHPEWLNRMLEDIADELGYHVGRMTASWGVSEEGRFIDEGVPGAWFWKPDDPYYHTVNDTPDKIDANLLKVVGDITAVTVWRLSQAAKISHDFAKVRLH